MEAIRFGQRRDLYALTDIYNYWIRAGFHTCDRTEFTEEERVSWFDQHSGPRTPLLVYETEGEILGYLTLSPYRPGREAVGGVAEVSYYIRPAAIGQGIGSALLERGLALARQENYHTVLAIVVSGNDRSISLLERHGFSRWGALPQIAFFASERRDHVYYGLQWR